MSLKRNIKVLGLALAAVFAASAITAVAAQATAPVWTVAGATPGAGNESNEIHLESTGTVTLNVPALGIEYKSTNNGDCTANGKIIGSAKGSPGTLTLPSLTCKNVETNNPNCQVSSENENVHGLVATEPITGTLVWLSGTQGEDKKVGVLFTPENAQFGKTLLTGASCPVSGTYNKTGCIIAEVTSAAITADVTKLELNFPATPIKKYWTNQTTTRVEDTCNGTKYGGNAATLSGEYDVVLKNKPAGTTFGIEPG